VLAAALPSGTLSLASDENTFPLYSTEPLSAPGLKTALVLYIQRVAAHESTVSLLHILHVCEPS
jgi:hypothetical protein